MTAEVLPLRVGSMPMLLLSKACGHPMTMYELAERVERTYNKVSDSPKKLLATVTRLEERGYVCRVGTRPSAGRPSALWTITPEGEETLNKCWDDLRDWKRWRA